MMKSGLISNKEQILCLQLLILSLRSWSHGISSYTIITYAHKQKCNHIVKLKSYFWTTQAANIFKVKHSVLKSHYGPYNMDHFTLCCHFVTVCNNGLFKCSVHESSTSWKQVVLMIHVFMCLHIKCMSCILSLQTYIVIIIIYMAPLP